MSNRAPETEKGPADEAPAWMLTYADTVTLLMTFFVMLLGFSTVDEEDFGRLSGALVGYWGVAAPTKHNRDSLESRRNMELGRIHPIGYEIPPDNDPLTTTERGMRIAVSVVSATNLLEHHLTAQGLEIRLQPGLVFEPGTARIRPENQHLLEVVVEAIRFLPNDIRVRASADRAHVPSNLYPSPRELSLARTVAACRWLREEGNIAPDRLRASVSMNEDILRFLRPAEQRGGVSDLTILVLARPKGRSNL